MKKILSILVLAGLALTGCVDDNPSVVLNGVVAGTCSPSGSDQDLWAYDICDPNALPMTTITLHLNNYITGEPPWSSSGGGSGTTFESETINPGMIFIDTIVAKCDSVDGNQAGCAGTEPLTISTNVPFPGNGGGVCSPMLLDIATVASWGDNVVLDIYVKYHDASLIKGESSHFKLPLQFQNNGLPCLYTPEEEDDSGNEDEEPID